MTITELQREIEAARNMAKTENVHSGFLLQQLNEAREKLSQMTALYDETKKKLETLEAEQQQTGVQFDTEQQKELSEARSEIEKLKAQIASKNQRDRDLQAQLVSVTARLAE